MCIGNYNRYFPDLTESILNKHNMKSVKRKNTCKGKILSNNECNKERKWSVNKI